MTPSRMLPWVCVAMLLGCGHVCAATLSPAGKMVDVYSLDGTGENYKSRYIRFRVIEALRRFYVCGENGVLHALTFDGKKLWTIQAPPFDRVARQIVEGK